MLRLLIVVGVSAIVFGQETPCCPPKQWQGVQAGRGGFYADGKPQILTIVSNVAVDRQQKLVYTFINTTSGDDFTSQMIYQNYAKNEQYVYNYLKNTCIKAPIDQKFYNGCIPTGAKYNGEYTIGAGSESVKAKSYSVHMKEAESILDAAVTVTAEQCVPIGESIVGSANKVPLTITYGYVNISPSISDPSIFNPPTICNKVQNSTVIEPQVHHHRRVF